MGRSPVYTLKVGLETFPFPRGWDDSNELHIAATNYIEKRNDIMHRMQVGLSKFYSYVNDRNCTLVEICNFREEVRRLDFAVLDLYGFSRASATYGFFGESSGDEEEGIVEINQVDDVEEKAGLRYGFAPHFADEILIQVLRLNNHLGFAQKTKGTSFKGKKRQLEIPSDGQLGLLSE